MSLLERHLDQISLSSESIATLPYASYPSYKHQTNPTKFPPPKIFTNALLSAHDITSLIRDTEPHERALFSVPPPQPLPSASTPHPEPKSNRRQTVFNVASGEVTTGAGVGGGSRVPRRNTAVAAVLGAELHGEVKRSEGKGEVDIEILLRGAEKLNDVYSVPGVPKKIDGLRIRYAQLEGSLRHYEEKVERQTRELERFNRGEGYGDEEEEEWDSEGRRTPAEEGMEITDEDLRREEEEIRDLERRKKELEDRVSGMERDLGGLLR